MASSPWIMRMITIPLTFWLLLHSQAYVNQPKELVTKDSTLLECDGVSLGVQFPVFRRTTMPSSLRPSSQSRIALLGLPGPKD
jgi:hypothetical protein